MAYARSPDASAASGSKSSSRHESAKRSSAKPER